MINSMIIFWFINRTADPLDEDYAADFTKDYYKRLTTIDTEDKDTTGIETPNPLFVFKNLKAEIDNPKLSLADKLEIVQQRVFLMRTFCNGKRLMIHIIHLR